MGERDGTTLPVAFEPAFTWQRVAGAARARAAWSTSDRWSTARDDQTWRVPSELLLVCGHKAARRSPLALS